MTETRTIDRFELREFIGRGAVGDVHRAYDPHLDRTIALKWIRKAGADPDALDAERHGAELQKQVAAIAPQVAAVYDYGETDEVFFVSMELIEGQDLSTILDAGPGSLSWSRSIALVIELCDLIETFHQFSTHLDGHRISGIVHGDIKPDNIRIQSDDRLRMLDFGIAKHLSGSRRATRNLFGSLPYAPPERLRSGMVDSASDLWAAGILLYVLASGQRPYDESGHEQLEHAIKSDPPRPLPESVPKALREVIEKATAFEATDRFASASELRAALELVAGQLPADSSRAGAVPAPGLDSEKTARTSATDESTRRTSAKGDATRRTGASNKEREREERMHERSEGGGIGAPPLPPTGAASSGPTRRTGAAQSAVSSNASAVLSASVASPPPLPPQVSAGNGADQPAASQGEDLAPRRRIKKSRRWISIAAGILLLMQVQAQRSASAIKENLGASAEPNVTREWRRFQSVAWLRPFDIGLWGAKRSLREALIADGDRVIAGFRTDTPSIQRDDWSQARRSLESALEINPNDREARARLYYAKAHIDRLEGRRLRGKGDSEGAEESVQEAVFGFERAAELDSEWADPYLGLARIHAYDAFHLERLVESLRGALARGYSWGRRERAQLADANHTRANQLLMSASDIQQAAGEGPLLREAKLHLQRAVSGYEQILDFGNARANRDTARKRLEQVDARLRQVRYRETEWS